MIALAKEFMEAFERYNWYACGDDQIDWHEVLDEIQDPSDEKEIREVIKNLKAATK
mgnify:CR=1 FL=1